MTRVPLMQALPWQTAGSTEMRSRHSLGIGSVYRSLETPPNSKPWFNHSLLSACIKLVKSHQLAKKQSNGHKWTEAVCAISFEVCAEDLNVRFWRKRSIGAIYSDTVCTIRSGRLQFIGEAVSLLVSPSSSYRTVALKLRKGNPSLAILYRRLLLCSPRGSAGLEPSEPSHDLLCVFIDQNEGPRRGYTAADAHEGSYSSYSPGSAPDAHRRNPSRHDPNSIDLISAPLTFTP